MQRHRKTKGPHSVVMLLCGTGEAGASQLVMTVQLLLCASLKTNSSLYTRLQDYNHIDKFHPAATM